MNRLILIVSLIIVLTASGCKHHKDAASHRHDYETSVRQDKKKCRPKEKKKDTNSNKRKSVVKEAHKWLGTPYAYGGKERKGTDCSGMVMRVFQDAAGIKLPRSSREQCDFCKKIKRKELAPADLVFFVSKAGGSRISHVGVYIGNGEFIHSSTSKGVIISSLDEKYYQRHYHAAGRVPGIGKGTAEVAEEPEFILDDDSTPCPGDKEYQELVNQVKNKKRKK